MTTHPEADADDEWMSLQCVTFSLFQSSDEQRGELLLNRSISTVCPVVENTLLWLNKLRSITHFPALASFPASSSSSSSSSCTHLCHSFHVPFSLALTSMKWELGLGSSELAQHHFGVLSRTRRGERREKHLLIPFAAKGMGSLLLLPLIVILSRPAQDTGDFIPWILVCMDKQEMRSNGVECFCLSANFLSVAVHPTKKLYADKSCCIVILLLLQGIMSVCSSVLLCRLPKMLSLNKLLLWCYWYLRSWRNGNIHLYALGLWNFHVAMSLCRINNLSSGWNTANLPLPATETQLSNRFQRDNFGEFCSNVFARQFDVICLQFL